jgi:glycosyltransferase involved in cell wall biosynthesis
MLIQVGPYPPPIGGISVYIKRMKDLLDSKGIENQVWDISNIKKSADGVVKMPLRFLSVPYYYAVRQKIDLIHYHICGIATKAYIGFFNKFLFKNRKRLITIHGDCSALSKRKTRLLVRCLNNFDVVICVKHNDSDYLLKHGVSSEVDETPAFIPPTVQDKDIADVSQRVWDFINAHRPVVTANACKIVFCHGQDLYGLDMCIELCAKLKKDYPQIGFVFCLPHIGDHTYFEKMQQGVMKNGLENNFMFYTKQSQLYPIIMRSDIFVRPSNTDGDAVSIREALHCKIPTVASDVVQRPEGTVLFRNRDSDDFTSKVRDILDNYELYKKMSEQVELRDNFEKIIKLYEKLLN